MLLLDLAISGQQVSHAGMVLAGIGFERVFQGATHGCLDPAYLLVPVEPLREKEEALHGQGIGVSSMGRAGAPWTFTRPRWSRMRKT